MVIFTQTHTRARAHNPTKLTANSNGCLKNKMAIRSLCVVYVLLYFRHPQMAHSKVLAMDSVDLHFFFSLSILLCRLSIAIMCFCLFIVFFLRINFPSSFGVYQRFDAIPSYRLRGKQTTSIRRACRCRCSIAVIRTCYVSCH